MATCVRCGRAASESTSGHATPWCDYCAAPAIELASSAPSTPKPVAAALLHSRLRATEFLIGVNVLVFVAMVASGVSPFDPSGEQLLPWGANFGPLSLGAQPWRILTCNYVHVGILHLALNMWCLWNLGKVAEHMFGRLTFLATYTVCGIAGSIATLWWHPFVPGAGASGAIFGLAGALITAIYLGKLPYPPSTLRSLGRSLLSFAGYNLLIGFFVPIIDNAAHLGGLAMGLLLGAGLASWLTERTPVRRRAERILFAGAALLLLGTELLVKKVNGYVVPLARAQEQLKTGDGRAVADLEAVVRSRPNDATLLRMLGISYLQNKNYVKAEEAFERLVQLRPNDLTARYDLGIAHGAAGQYAEAERVFAELTRLDPGNDDFWLLRASSLKELHRTDEAQAALQKALQLNPQSYQAHRELGWLQLDSNRPDAALESFRRAIKIEPQDANSQLGLSRTYEAKGMEEESAAALERYNTLRPSEPAAPTAK